MKMRIALLITSLLLVTRQTDAGLVTFSGSASGRSASVTFETNSAAAPTQLLVTLTNTSTMDALVPTDVLTAVFFNSTGLSVNTNPLASPLTYAKIAAGSLVTGASQPAGGYVGGEFAFATGLSGAPGGANSGISSSGLGLFGSGNFYDYNNLAGPSSIDGLQYGITTAGDNPNTHNSGADTPLIQNSVQFTLNIGTGFNLAGINQVSFQYGTSLDEPNVPGTTPELDSGPTPVPEPASAAMWFVLGVFGLRYRPGKKNG